MIKIDVRRDEEIMVKEISKKPIIINAGRVSSTQAKRSKKRLKKETKPISHSELMETRMKVEFFLSAAINQLEDESCYLPFLENDVIYLEEVLDGIVEGKIVIQDAIQLITDEQIELSEIEGAKISAAIQFLDLSLAHLYKIKLLS
jgi:hypothetical protein